MDARSLQELWQGPSPFLAQMGKSAFDLAQEKQQADLATTLGLEQRNQAMHPAELAGKEAVTRLNNSTAAMNEDVLSRRIPAKDERKAALQKAIAGMDDTSRAQMKAQVVRNMQLAAMMEKNGGMLPQGFNLSPEEMQIFTPKNLKNIIAHGQAFLEMDPEEISKRQRAAEAQRLEQIKNQGRIEVKGTPSAGGGGTPKQAKSPRELMTEYTLLANRAEPGSAEQKKFIALADAEWQKVQQEIILKALAGQGGKVDPVSTANNPAGDVVGRPMPQPSPMPTGNNPAVAPSQGSPAQQRTVRMKASNGTIYEVAADKVDAAKARGWTVQ